MSENVLLVFLLLVGVALMGCMGTGLKTESKTLQAPITIGEPVNVEVTPTPLPPFTIVENPEYTPVVIVEKP